MLLRHYWGEPFIHSSRSLGGCCINHQRITFTSTFSTQVSFFCSPYPFSQAEFDSKNRFAVPSQDLHPDTFSGITEVHISATLMTWSEMQIVTKSMPHLQTVILGHNDLSTLESPSPHTLKDSKVQTINLDGNLLENWIHICAAVFPYSE